MKKSQPDGITQPLRWRYYEKHQAKHYQAQYAYNKLQQNITPAIDFEICLRFIP